MGHVILTIPREGLNVFHLTYEADVIERLIGMVLLQYIRVTYS